MRFKRIRDVHASERSIRGWTYGFGAGVTVIIVDVPVPTTPTAGGEMGASGGTGFVNGVGTGFVGGATGFVGGGIVVPGG
ncbi:MAG TPA: hypothetical protein VFU28_09405 [Vicinamibacterales bacterium]|nr:hypothetical protein [Vicinamibacterales bacterium]